MKIKLTLLSVLTLLISQAQANTNVIEGFEVPSASATTSLQLPHVKADPIPCPPTSTLKIMTIDKLNIWRHQAWGASTVFGIWAKHSWSLNVGPYDPAQGSFVLHLAGMAVKSAQNSTTPNANDKGKTIALCYYPTNQANVMAILATRI